MALIERWQEWNGELIVIRRKRISDNGISDSSYSSRSRTAGGVTFGCMVNGAVHGRQGEVVEHLVLHQELAVALRKKLLMITSSNFSRV